jgi:hypothetical protein
MAPPPSPRRTRVKNATQRPGLVLLEGKQKRRTQAQIKEDKQRTNEAQAAQEADLQRGLDRIASIEAAMEVEQGIQATAKAKPVKPRARPVKKKVGAASELTSGSLPVPPAPAKTQGGMKGQDAGDVGERNVEAVGNEVAKPPKKTKKVHEPIGATILGGDQRVKGTGTDKKGNHIPSVNLSSHHHVDAH